MSKLYIIECNQGAPLSSWSEPETLEGILDRYYEQYMDMRDEDEPTFPREDFTAEMFQDIWDCELLEFVEAV